MKYHMANNLLNSGFEIMHLHTFTDTDFKLSSRKKGTQRMLQSSLRSAFLISLVFYCRNP